MSQVNAAKLYRQCSSADQLNIPTNVKVKRMPLVDVDQQVEHVTSNAMVLSLILRQYTS